MIMSSSKMMTSMHGIVKKAMRTKANEGKSSIHA